MSRAEEIRKQVEEKVASFKVGDEIEFCLYDDTGCNENTGDPVEIKMTGRITAINGQHATVEHKWGTCSTWLAIAKKVELCQHQPNDSKGS